MRTLLAGVAIGILLVTLAGCGRLMHPRAGEMLAQAKGADGIETQTNLIAQMDRSIDNLRGQRDYEAGLETLHNQLYALREAGCEVTEAQSKTPAYARVVTLRKEVGTVFHRLWKTREDHALRDIHLDLLDKRLHELSDALHTVKG